MLKKGTMKELYVNLFQMRMIEETLTNLYAAGRIPGHIHSGMGQESTFAAVIQTKKEGDYFKLPHRPAAAAYTVGTPLDIFFGEILAKRSGNSGGRGGIIHVGRLQDGILGMSGALASDAAVPLGAAYTIDYEGRDNVAYAFFGDGTCNRGPVAEAMALAAAWKLPVLFICENNGFAISTNQEITAPSGSALAGKASGYGMPSMVVDGTDIEAVYEAASKLVEGIRKGEGPAVLECKSYRWRGHFEGDQCAYRDKAVTENKTENNDPLKKYEKKVLEMGLYKQSEIDKMKKDFEEEINSAVSKAEAEAPTTEEELANTLFAD